MEKKRRFVSTTDEEIEQKRLKTNAQKNIKQNIAAETLLREYLKENICYSRFPYMVLPSIVIFRKGIFQWPVKRINLIL
jgi:hypothetical protein